MKSKLNITAQDNKKLSPCQHRFGFESLDYETTSKSMGKQIEVYNSSPRSLSTQVNSKKELRSCHFSLGEEPACYERSNAMPNYTNDHEAYRIKHVHSKYTSLPTFGYEKTSSETTSSSATSWTRKNSGHEAKVLRDRQISKETQDPRKSNLYFGDDFTKNVSTTKSAFQYDSTAVTRSELSAQAKEDLRKCHFSLGHDIRDYSTSNSMQIPSAELIQQQKELLGRKHVQENHICFSNEN